MEVYILKDKFKEEDDNRGILRYFNLSQPVEILGVLEYIPCTQSYNSEHNEDQLVARQHKGQSVASLSWGRRRLSDGSHIWKPTTPGVTLGDIEDNEDDVPVMWIPRHITVPAQNKYAKNLLDKFDC